MIMAGTVNAVRSLVKKSLVRLAEPVMSLEVILFQLHIAAVLTRSFVYQAKWFAEWFAVYLLYEIFWGPDGRLFLL